MIGLKVKGYYYAWRYLKSPCRTYSFVRTLDGCLVRNGLKKGKTRRIEQSQEKERLLTYQEHYKL